MSGAEFGSQVQAWGELILLWVGFGTVVGLMAKAIMPGRDPGGSIATVLMGIGGAIIGCGVLTYCYEGIKISPISPAGFMVATLGAFTILFFYRVLAGYWFIEGDEITRRSVRRRRGRRWNEVGE